jgi:hypothetical protein
MLQNDKIELSDIVYSKERKNKIGTLFFRPIYFSVLLLLASCAHPMDRVYFSKDILFNNIADFYKNINSSSSIYVYSDDEQIDANEVGIVQNYFPEKNDDFLNDKTVSFKEINGIRVNEVNFFCPAKEEGSFNIEGREYLVNYTTIYRYDTNDNLRYFDIYRVDSIMRYEGRGFKDDPYSHGKKSSSFVAVRKNDCHHPMTIIEVAHGNIPAEFFLIYLGVLSLNEKLYYCIILEKSQKINIIFGHLRDESLQLKFNRKIK